MRTEALACSVLPRSKQPIPSESVSASKNYSVPDYWSSRIVVGLRVTESRFQHRLWRVPAPLGAILVVAWRVPIDFGSSANGSDLRDRASTLVTTAPIFLVVSLDLDVVLIEECCFDRDGIPEYIPNLDIAPALTSQRESDGSIIPNKQSRMNRYHSRNHILCRDIPRVPCTSLSQWHRLLLPLWKV